MVGTLVYIIGAQLVAFAVIVFVLKRLLLNDTLNALGRLRQVEADLGKKEDVVRKRIEDNEKEFQRKGEEAQEQLARLKEQQERDLAKMKDALVEEARRERDRILADAEKNKDKMRQDLVREMDERAVDYAGRVFELVFSEKIGDSLNRAFVDELLEALEEVEADSITIEADAAEIASSHPLDDGQRQRLRDILGRKFGVQVDVKETVNPALVAGVKIKIGSLEVDGSLLNRFGEALEEVRRKRDI